MFIIIKTWFQEVKICLWELIHSVMGSSVAFYLLLSLVGSLGFSIVYSPDIYADEYVSGINTLIADSPAVDINTYMNHHQLMNSNFACMYLSSQGCLSTRVDFSFPDSYGSTGSIYKPNEDWSSWASGGYSGVVLRIPYDTLDFWSVIGDSTITTSPTYGKRAVGLSCSGRKFYWGDSYSFDNVHIDSGTVQTSFLSTNPSSSFSGLFNQSNVVNVGSSQYYSLSRPTYNDKVSLSYSNLSSDNNAIAIWEYDGSSGSDSDFYFINLRPSQWDYYNFYAENSDGLNTTTASWDLNGLVVGCSASAVQSMLEANSSGSSSDSGSIVPNGFPSSFDTDDNQNNEDAWNILNNLNPSSFEISNSDSTNIISVLLGWLRTLLTFNASQNKCQLYMPSFFGNRFKFGNSGGDNSILYINLCNNGFVSTLWNSSSWLGMVSGQTQYDNQSWFYIGFKGLIWLFCGWVLVKILLGYVYWVYSTVDTIFGLNNDLEDS